MLTGGPCGGKTTGQAHLATFFESLGWKVFRVPETATVLMSGGISFGELNEEQVRELVDGFYGLTFCRWWFYKFLLNALHIFQEYWTNLTR